MSGVILPMKANMLDKISQTVSLINDITNKAIIIAMSTIFIHFLFV